MWMLGMMEGCFMGCDKFLKHLGFLLFLKSEAMICW